MHNSLKIWEIHPINSRRGCKVPVILKPKKKRRKVLYLKVMVSRGFNNEKNCVKCTLPDKLAINSKL